MLRCFARGERRLPRIALDSLGSRMLQSASKQRGSDLMDDAEKERAERNKDLVARMCAPPTRAQILAEIDLEIGDAIHLAAAANFPSVVRLLRMAKFEVAQVKQRRDIDDKR
jgi:hypothetical protein